MTNCERGSPGARKEPPLPQGTKGRISIERALEVVDPVAVRKEIAVSVWWVSQIRGSLQSD